MIFDFGNPRNDVRWVFDLFCWLDIRGEIDVRNDLRFGVWLLVCFLREKYPDEMVGSNNVVVQIVIGGNLFPAGGGGGINVGGNGSLGVSVGVGGGGGGNGGSGGMIGGSFGIGSGGSGGSGDFEICEC